MGQKAISAEKRAQINPLNFKGYSRQCSHYSTVIKCLDQWLYWD